MNQACSSPPAEGAASEPMCQLAKCRLSLRARLLLSSLFALAVASNPGCTAKSHKGESQPGEPSWEEQVRHVADSRSDAIRIETHVIRDTDLDAIQNLSALRELVLDNTTVSDHGVRKLIGLQRLEHIRIRGGTVGDQGLRDLCRLPQLRIFNLPQAKFSDDGLQHLTQLSHLELLRFGSPYVTDAGLDHIAHIKSLKFLHFIDVPITDAGLDKLHDMKQLESLYVDGGKTTDEGIGRLLAALPDLHFHIDQRHSDRDPHRHDHAH